MKESDIERAVCRYAQDQGWLTPKCLPPAQRGWPDRLFLGPEGQHVFIEFKAPNQKLRPLQEFRVKELIKRKHLVYIVDNIEYGYRIVKFHATRLSAERYTETD